MFTERVVMEDHQAGLLPNYDCQTITLSGHVIPSLLNVPIPGSV